MFLFSCYWIYLTLFLLMQLLLKVRDIELICLLPPFIYLYLFLYHYYDLHTIHSDWMNYDSLFCISLTIAGFVKWFLTLNISLLPNQQCYVLGFCSIYFYICYCWASFSILRLSRFLSLTYVWEVLNRLFCTWFMWFETYFLQEISLWYNGWFACANLRGFPGKLWYKVIKWLFLLK